MSIELTNFLKKQNVMLKQENKQLKTLLELNRQALKVSTQSKKGQGNFPVLVNLLFQENSKLHKKINQLSTDLETGMCMALISEQIAFASTQQQRSLTLQLKEKLSRMRKQLQHRQKKIVQMTKHQSEKKSNGHPQNKVIEYTDLTAVTKKLKDQINELRNDIEQKRQQVTKYKDQKQQLLKLNLILTKQINEYKLITSHQSTGSNQISSGDLSKFLNYQKRIIEDEDDPQSDQDHFEDTPSDNSSDMNGSEIEEQVPNKVPKINKLDISKVPKLELTKAKQIQQLIVQKINNDDNKKKGGTVKQQKFKKLQVQTNNLRKKVGAMMLQKMDIEKQNSFLKKFVKQLQGRNQILCQGKKQNHETVRKQISMMQQSNRFGQQNEQTETLLDICKDVTLNPVLRKVVNGSLELPFNNNIRSYDI